MKKYKLVVASLISTFFLSNANFAQGTSKQFYRGFSGCKIPLLNIDSLISANRENYLQRNFKHIAIDSSGEFVRCKFGIDRELSAIVIWYEKRLYRVEYNLTIGAVDFIDEYPSMVDYFESISSGYELLPTESEMTYRFILTDCSYRSLRLITKHASDVATIVCLW